MARARAVEVDEVNLGSHDGRDVLRTTVKVTNAGDGLSKAMSVDPVELHHGETVVLVLECEVGTIAYEPIKDTNGVMRIHTLKAGTATLIDEDSVREALDAQQAKIDANNGVFHLPFSAVDGERPDGMSDEEWEESGRSDAELAAAEAAEKAGEG